MTFSAISGDLSWLLPLIVGAALTGLQPLVVFLWSRRKRPILQVYQSIDPRETYVDIGLEGEASHGYFVAVKVRNRGVRAAKGCYAKLIRLEKRTASDRYERILELRDPEMLGWANRGTRRFEEQSVESDIPQTIDLCNTDQRHPEFVYFDVRQTAAADGRQRFFREGVYRASVRVYADGVRPATAYFLVCKGAGWKDLSIEQTSGVRAHTVPPRLAQI